MTQKLGRAHITVEFEESSTTSSTNINTSVQASSTVSPKKSKREIVAEPPFWEQVFDGIKEYRKNVSAPVDTMGCERLADQPSEIITPQTSRFQTLVSLMLSSQTKDPITAAAVRNLRERLPGGLTMKSVSEADESFLDECISKVGFHQKKARNIKEVAKICKRDYNGDIPDTVEALMDLPGVGPKMTYLCMQCAWKKNVGIGVDVHVHRISNRLGWCKTEKNGPEATRKVLESWLPQPLWAEINQILVGFGQTTCLPRNPKCSECPVNDLCPSSTVGSTSVTKRKRTRV